MQTRLWAVLVLSLAVALIALASLAPAYAEQPVAAARNVILLIGDGMGPAQLEAGRREAAATGRQFAMDSMPVRSAMTTLSYGGNITDSAASATALATGCKTVNRALGIDPHGAHLPNIAEAVKAAGGMVGLVSTCSITSATPAGFVVHIDDRGSGRDIARALIEARTDLVLGGGAALFMPTLFERARPALEMAKEAGYTVVMEKDELEAASGLPLLGLFAPTDMAYEVDRDPTEEPSLRRMAQKALDLLAASSGEAGFFLMVEGGRIDHACHANDAARLPAEVAAFDDAIWAVLDFARRRGDTLVIVTADHETGQLEVRRDGQLVFGSDDHTDTPVPVFAEGPGQEWFDVDMLDNTDIAKLMARALGVLLERSAVEVRRPEIGWASAQRLQQIIRPAHIADPASYVGIASR